MIAEHAARVAGYYDHSTEAFYRRYWDAEDIHFGLFEPGTDERDLRTALKRMTWAVALPSRIGAADLVLDAGCGTGGAALDLGRALGCRVVGLTVSDRQVELARLAAAEAGLSELVRFERADCADRLPFDDASVDVVLSIEAACHFADRGRFAAECARVLKPGGRVALSDWVARDGIGDEARGALEALCRSWLLAGLETPGGWASTFGAVGFDVLECQDFGDTVLPNVRLLERFAQELRLEAASRGGQRTAHGVWRRQIETLVLAWRRRYFTVARLLAVRELARAPNGGFTAT